jgi:hypothetical protein
MEDQLTQLASSVFYLIMVGTGFLAVLWLGYGVLWVVTKVWRGK